MKTLPPRNIKLRAPGPGRRAALQSEGFSLVEVLVSILMIAAFLATAMQALVAATAIKVRSEEISEATTWMQEDLEAIRFEANQLGFDPDANTYNPDLNDDGNTEECDAGFAETIRNALQDTSGIPRSYKYPNDQGQRKESAVGQRPYFIKRILTADSSGDPGSNPNILKIEHQIFADRDGDLREELDEEPIGELYSEVIPDVAFACP